MKSKMHLLLLALVMRVWWNEVTPSGYIYYAKNTGIILATQQREVQSIKGKRVMKAWYTVKKDNGKVIFISSDLVVDYEQQGSK